MKEQSPVGRIWELGEKEHGKLITAVILAVLGVACGMAPYFAVGINSPWRLFGTHGAL